MTDYEKFKRAYDLAQVGADLDNAIDTHLTHNTQVRLYDALCLCKDFCGIDMRANYLRNWLKGKIEERERAL